MRRLTTFVSMLFLLLLTTCLTPISAQAKVNLPQPLQVSSAYDLIQAVNDLRASYGLPAYQTNSILMAVAQAHSEYQASIGTCTHYGPNGEIPRDRALAAGYPVSGYFSENIQAGSNLSAQFVVNAWTGDDLHLGTMLSPNLTEVGGGVACAGSYCYYTLDAALPSGTSLAYRTTTSGRTVSSTRTVIPNTPNADGAIIHIVQKGDTIYGIAFAYGIQVEELLRLNGLALNSVLYVGKQLIIRPAFTPTPTLPTSTPTRRPTPTPWLTSTATTTPTSTPVTSTPIPKAGIPASTGIVSVSVIILLALLMAGAIAWLGARGANK